MPKEIERPESSIPTTNLFLARLEREDCEALTREAKIVTLKFRRRVILQDTSVDAVYFPLTCMFSLLVTSADGKPQMERLSERRAWWEQRRFFRRRTLSDLI